MRCGPPANVTMVMIGLQQVGITGLRDAFKELDGGQVATSDLRSATDRQGPTEPASRHAENASELAVDESILDFLEQQLSELNYVPTSQRALYRRALWREYVRYRGGDIRPFFSEIDVRVRGDAGEVRDRFISTLLSVFADFELLPLIELVDAGDANERRDHHAQRDHDARHHHGKQGTAASAGGQRGDLPALEIDDTVVVRGLPSRERFKAAVRKTISDW